jgi:hypothetical protein
VHYFWASYAVILLYWLHECLFTLLRFSGNKKSLNDQLCNAKRSLLEMVRSGQLSMSSVLMDIEILRILFADILDEQRKV